MRFFCSVSGARSRSAERRGTKTVSARVSSQGDAGRSLHDKRWGGLKRITVQGPSHGANRKAARSLGREGQTDPAARGAHKPGRLGPGAEAVSGPVMSKHETDSRSALNAKPDRRRIGAL